MSTPDISIRDAALADIPAIVLIYTDAVVNTVATMDNSTPTLESQTEWFRHHDARHPVLVAESDGQTVGWASISAWSDRGGYRDTAEASVYVSPEWRRQGIGKRLLMEVVSRARNTGLHVLLARISTTNETSLKLVRDIGFEDIGTMREVGRKFGELVDVQILEMLMEEQEDTSDSR